MTDQKSDAKSTPPGSGAGDAAHSMRIPNIDRADSPVVKTDKGRTRSTGPKPLSASDYARTTRTAPDTTSVIPSVKSSETVVDEKPAPAQTPVKKPAVEWEEPATARPVDPEPAESGSGVGGRSAILRMAYIEPWSVTRMAFAISVAMMIVAVVATAIFWLVLEVTGVWGQIDDSVTSVLSDDAAGFNITDYLGFGRLVGLALVLSALNVVIMTILATIAAHLYNLGAQLLGGFQVRFVSKN